MHRETGCAVGLPVVTLKPIQTSVNEPAGWPSLGRCDRSAHPGAGLAGGTLVSACGERLPARWPGMAEARMRTSIGGFAGMAWRGRRIARIAFAPAGRWRGLARILFRFSNGTRDPRVRGTCRASTLCRINLLYIHANFGGLDFTSTPTSCLPSRHLFDTFPSLYARAPISNTTRLNTAREFPSCLTLR